MKGWENRGKTLTPADLPHGDRLRLRKFLRDHRESPITPLLDPAPCSGGRAALLGFVQAAITGKAYLTLPEKWVCSRCAVRVLTSLEQGPPRSVAHVEGKGWDVVLVALVRGATPPNLRFADHENDEKKGK